MLKTAAILAASTFVAFLADNQLGLTEKLPFSSTAATKVALTAVLGAVALRMFK